MHTLFILAAETQQRLVLDLLAILAAAAAVAMLLSRIRLAAIPAYIITGALIGPGATRMITDLDNIENISELAILLLMFTVGLHLQSSGYRPAALRVAAVGVGSTLGSILLTWPLAMAFGLSAPAALAVSMAMAMSSTAVVLRILQQRREMHSEHGRTCVAIAISQDLISLLVLAVMPLLAAWAGSHSSNEMIKEPEANEGMAKGLSLRLSSRRGIAGITVMILVGRMLLPRLLREAAKDVSAETLLVLSAAVALGAAVAAGALGFSPELGAFLAGFVLAGTDFRHQLTGQLSPMRDLFMAVFFTAVGLKLNIGALAEHWWLIALALPLVMLVKASTIGMSTWLGGATASNAVLVGLLLSQAGEFSLVVLDSASDLGLVTPSQSGASVAVVVLSLVVTPSVADFARRFKERFNEAPTLHWVISHGLHAESVAAATAVRAAAEERGEKGVHGSSGGDGGGALPTPGAPLRKHVIIAGFGIVGRNLAEHFAASSIPYTVVELNPETVRRQRKLGRSIIFGDVANLEVLESAGVHEAEAVVLTIPDDDATLRACRAIRQAAPKVYIAARTPYLSRAIQATELGADHVTVEEMATAKDMATQVMARLMRAPKPAPEAPGVEG